MIKPIILILDDDEGIQETLCDIFEQKDFAVNVASLGAEALALAEKNKFDIALIDIKLPDIEGISVLEKLKKTNPDMICCIITGNASLATSLEALKHGANDYFVKPIVIDKMLHSLESALEKQRISKMLKESEASLRKEARYWETTFDAMDDAVCLLDLKGKILRCNKAMAKFLRKPFAEIIGSSCWELVHRTQEPIPECPVLRMRETRQRETMIKQDGEKIIQVTVDPILDENGNLFQIVHIISDITERKHAEDNLRDSEEKYRVLFKSASDAVLLVNVETMNILDANEAAVTLYGYTYKELLKLKAIDLSAEAKQTKKVLQDNFSTYIPIRYHRKKDGRIFPVEITTNFLKLKNQKIHISNIRDISVRIEAEKESKNLEEKLSQAQKMESVGRLAGGVAHDYNNALTTIMGFTELAMMDADPEGPLHKDLDEVFKAGKRAKDITRQLLAFARKQTIAPKVLDLNENIESMFKMLRRLIGENIDIVWQPGTNLWPVKMDPSQIDQILANLCVNARDAIEDVGTVTIETDIVTFDKAYCADHKGFIPGGFVLLAVSDNGCGMDKETLDKIFEPFFTTKDVDKGTGLGLATVYGIVKQNNGFVNVYSEPGEGTSIKIYLPQHEGKAVGNQGESTEEIPQGLGETILVVEDDMPILKLAKKILEGLGYKVLTADTPKGAMRLAKEYKSEIQLLVTDVIMPEMNGRELSEQMQSLYPDLKCIFMSGYTANAIAHHGVLDEGMEFIQKPCSQADLAKTVRNVLDRKSN